VQEESREGFRRPVVATKLIDIGIKGRQRIDRYELVGEIASGGMATVYLARLTGVGGFQRFVAIKRLHPHLAGEEEFVQMFLDEARLAAGIHHPNVVPILEVGASHLGYYLVMEYIEGDTLARLLARAAGGDKQLPVAIGLRVVLDMLAGLHAAHELRDDRGEPTNLVHRDVSPQNVLVGADGIARITDFGVARAASRLSETRIGQLKGKIAYMAPEQAMGIEDLDRRADVFSSGVVVWEALSARRLFKAETEAATLTRLISEEIPPLNEMVEGVSQELSAVVAKALERDPNRRYVSCAQFAEALEAAGTITSQVGSSRDLAAYVSVAIGDEIAQQREAVRAWLARSESTEDELPERWPAGLSRGLPGGTETHSGMIATQGENTQASGPSAVTIVTRPASWALLVAMSAIILLLGVVIYLLFKLSQSQVAQGPQPVRTVVIEDVPDEETGQDPEAQPTTPSRPTPPPRKLPEPELKDRPVKPAPGNPYR
jgi:serine/threonine protein kinase